MATTAITPNDEWKHYLRTMVSNAEAARRDWRLLANELLKYFPTETDFKLHIGTIGDTIVEGFNDEEKRIFTLDIPKKQRNFVDEYMVVRKKKK